MLQNKAKAMTPSSITLNIIEPIKPPVISLTRKLQLLHCTKEKKFLFKVKHFSINKRNFI